MEKVFINFTLFPILLTTVKFVLIFVVDCEQHSLVPLISDIANNPLDFLNIEHYIFAFSNFWNYLNKKFHLIILSSYGLIKLKVGS